MFSRALPCISRSRVLSSGVTRFYSTGGVQDDLRSQLTTQLKAAMKSKDSMKSTTIRSILSEVYLSDKTQPQPVGFSVIAGILRKAAARRLDSATEYEKASRSDLAEKERQEASLIESFLPPLLPEADIDRTLQQVFSEEGITPGSADKKAIGQVFKAFYAKVDRSSVDSDLVTRRAKALLSSS